MAHKLAHNGGSDRSAAESDNDGKGLLNRRQYIKIGTASATALLIGGTSVGASGAAADTGEHFLTDFSEGSL